MLKKINFDKVDKVLFEGNLTNGLKLICAPMVGSINNAAICIYVNVGGYPRDYSIGKQKIYPSTANIVAEALMKNHSKEAEPLFKDGVRLSCGVSESYTFFKAEADKSVIPSLVKPLLSLIDNLVITNDESEALKKEYIDSKISIHKDDIEFRIRDALYFSSPMKYSYYGNPEDAKNVHYISLRKFFNEFYAVDNITMFAVGDLVPSIIEKTAGEFVFSKKASEGEISIKSISENYAAANKLIVETDSKNKFGVAFKLPSRKEMFEKFQDKAFAYYELLPYVFFSKGNRNADKMLPSFNKIVEKGIRQGGEDAFIYVIFDVKSKDAAKGEMEAYLSSDKLLSFFDFGKIKREFFTDLKRIYKSDVDGYLARLLESFANSLADLSLAEEGKRSHYSKVKSFAELVLSLPRIYIC